MQTVEYYSALKKEVLPCVTTGMNLMDGMLCEISQPEEQMLCGPIEMRDPNGQTLRNRQQGVGAGVLVGMAALRAAVPQTVLAMRDEQALELCQTAPCSWLPTLYGPLENLFRG